MQSSSQYITNENLAMLAAIASTGSLAAAARALDIVPSAMTYRLRQLEDAVDALLVQRSSKRSQLTPAGVELLKAGQPVMDELEALSQRVKRIATGWEPELVIVIDALIQESVLLDLCQAFYALGAPTQLRLLRGAMNGTLEPLLQGQADLSLGIFIENAQLAGINSSPLGEVPFVCATAPQHPLAQRHLEGVTITDALRAQHLAIAVADTSRRRTASTLGVVQGQPVLTVPDMRTKLKAQLAGLGCGYLPLSLAHDHIQNGDLVVIELNHPPRSASLSMAWREDNRSAGQALKWWLKKLQPLRTRQALIGHTRPL